MAFNIEAVKTIVKQLAAEGIVFTVTYDKSPDINIHYRANYDHAEAYVHEGGKDGKPNYEIYLNGCKIIEQKFDLDKIFLKDLLYTVAECAGDLDQSIEDFNEDIERLTD
jgi:methanogenic corrinoid protein MtbC1